MYTLYYAARTHGGHVRGNNEDNFFVNGTYRQDTAAGEAACAGTVTEGALTACVCDGMGGHDRGEVASLLAVQALAALEREQASFQADGMGCVERLNLSVWEENDREKTSIGTTLALVEFRQDRALALNVGDSRIYRMRDGTLTQLSEDHTLVAGMVRTGQITPEEAAGHPLRHHITQYLGICPQELRLEPAFAGPMELRAGDRFLVCSDGLTDMLDDGRIAGVLEQNGDVENAARALVQAALAAGGKDNVTVVLVEAGQGRSKLRTWTDRLSEKLTGR